MNLTFFLKSGNISSFIINKKMNVLFTGEIS